MLKQVLKILRWIGIYLVCLETFLWLGGQGFIFIQTLQNRAGASEDNVYKIMCLGDSITAEGGEGSYPRQLERYLNKNASKRQFKVTNHGIPSADSTMILQRVNQFIADENPNMVVVMMGYNDKSFLKPNKVENVWDRTVSRLKVSRLLNSLGQKLVAHINSKVFKLKMRFLGNKFHVTDEQKLNGLPAVPPKYTLLFLQAVQLEEQKEYSKAELILANLLQLDVDNKTFLDQVWYELSKCVSAQKEYKKLIFLAWYKLQADPFHTQATEYVRNLCREKREEQDILGMLSSLLEKNPKSIPLTGLLAACSADYGHIEQANAYFELIKSLESQGQNVVLEDNYKKLYEILKERRIKPVFVQYPNRDVKVLKNLFNSGADYEDIIFVENETNFKDSLDQNRYSQYFIDRAGDNFGHGTSYGNFLIASQIGAEILKYLNF